MRRVSSSLRSPWLHALLGPWLALACGCSGNTRHGGAGGSSGCSNDCGGSAAMAGGAGTPSAEAMSQGGSAAAALQCPGASPSCGGATQIQLCQADSVATIGCPEAMAIEGIVSHGCLPSAAGDGCSIDGFLDPECEAGAAPFVLCQGLAERDLLDTYVTCAQGNPGTAVIACYRDFVSPSGVVDCGAARAVCDSGPR